MGSFSWCYCDKIIRRNSAGELAPTRSQRMLYGSPGHVLFPKEFGGKRAQIDENYYTDYGRFRNPKDETTYDIYDLVADWNREWLAKHPEWIRPSEITAENPKPISEKSWYPLYADLQLSRDEVVERWIKLNENENRYAEWRLIGIYIACEDEDNASLPYPIKISRNGKAVYEDCGISYSDPYQGWLL